MLQHFHDFILQQKLFTKQQKILLAVSGGIDSVVMCELFSQAGVQFGIAHCNFKLRGKESDQDELFVKALAKKYQVPFYSQSFLADKYSEKQGVSIQMAARELRYNFFEKIRKAKGYHFIATAHHKDDSIETFFINLIRGTGIAGLHGILPKQNNIIRPLLFSSKTDIEQFAEKHRLSHREDSSNKSDKYLRNKIRHHIVPLLKSLNQNIDGVIAENIDKIRDVEQIYIDAIEKIKKRTIIVKKEKATISIKKLKQLSPLKAYLFEFLKPYHFHSATINSIIKCLDSDSGKQFLSPTHRLVKDRETLIIISKEKYAGETQLNYTIKSKKGFKIPVSKKIACLDYEKLKLPLKIREWKNGDFFYPLGMKQKKKLSDFFVDNKVSIPDKENTYVLTSGNHVVWVIGMRIDDRFKITDQTSKVYVCELIEE